MGLSIGYPSCRFTRVKVAKILLGHEVPVLKMSEVFHCYLYYAPQFLSMPILTALLLAEARLQHPL